MLPTIIIRHYKERVSKCSVQGLRGRPDCIFRTFGKKQRIDLSGLPDLKRYIRLDPSGEPIDPALDADKGLLLIDATWRYAGRIVPFVADVPARALPENIKTAYPRRQPDAPDPARGLASIEALYVAFRILGRDTAGLLDHYYWKDRFLDINAGWIP